MSGLYIRKQSTHTENRIFPYAEMERLESELFTKVRKLAENMEQALYSRGFARDKKAFTPHLTIGRVRGRIPKNKIERFIEQEKAFETAKVRVDGVVLFESRLTPEGAIHTQLYTASLGS